MTPEEQWLEINYSRVFLIAVVDRVKAVRAALATLDATADRIVTNVNGVPLIYSESGEYGSSNEGTGWCHIEVGTQGESEEPQIVLDIPMRWVVET